MKHIEYIMNSLQLDTLRYIDKTKDAPVYMGGKKRVQGWGCKTVKGGFRMLSNKTVADLKTEGVQFPSMKGGPQ
jgi:hypothetical protein